ncbi:hypothetical protein GT002_38695, partial [Streptomyces sp. SID4917]
MSDTDAADAGAADVGAGTVERALHAVLSTADGERSEGLDTGASLLAADPAADAELRLRGVGFVRLAWERGWQPADVVRLL